VGLKAALRAELQQVALQQAALQQAQQTVPVQRVALVTEMRVTPFCLEVCRNDFQLAYVLMKHACQRKRCLIL
jgi:hypothetical protein